MTRAIEFYFDFRSPYSYLAATQLPGLAARTGAVIAYRPIDVFEVMSRVGNTPTTVQCPVKRRYAMADLARWAARYAVPLERNPHFETIPARDLALGAVVAAERGQAPAYVRAIFEAVWIRQSAFADDGETLEILRRGGVEDGEAILAGRTAAAPAFDATIDEAVAAGVFGAPMFRVGEALFFGNDRLDFLAEELAR